MVSHTAPRSPAVTARLPAEMLALAFALVGVIGSVFLSAGMKLTACPLCFYQRSFIMAVAVILGLGNMLRVPVPAGTLSLLALAPAVAGLGVALAHNVLVWNGTLLCPGGVLGLGTAPLQSLVIFVLVTVLLLPGAFTRVSSPVPALPRVVLVAATGAILTGLCMMSAPPLPPYKASYDPSGKRLVKGCERRSPEYDPSVIPNFSR